MRAPEEIVFIAKELEDEGCDDRGADQKSMGFPTDFAIEASKIVHEGKGGDKKTPFYEPQILARRKARCRAVLICLVV